MSNASTLGKMSPELLRVVERAKQEPEGRFHSLAHLIDVPALERAFRRSREDAAPGVDGVTKEQYGQDLERNLHDLATLPANHGLHEKAMTLSLLGYQRKRGGDSRAALDCFAQALSQYECSSSPSWLPQTTSLPQASQVDVFRQLEGAAPTK